MNYIKIAETSYNCFVILDRFFFYFRNFFYQILKRWVIPFATSQNFGNLKLLSHSPFLSQQDSTIGVPHVWTYNYFYGPGLIQERKGIRVIFQKKGKIS